MKIAEEEPSPRTLEQVQAPAVAAAPSAQLRQIHARSAQVAQLQAYSAIANGSRKQVTHSGLPQNLQSGVESLSGIAMDDVRVHYNSSKPAQLQAHAYAQGTDIHLAPGQEKHLAHEAWHVVQQKQGRVKPTLQMKGVAINDDSALEREADRMGDRAMLGGGQARSVNAKGLDSQRQPMQLKGRKGAFGEEKTVLKLVMAGSGYKLWATHKEEEIGDMTAVSEKEKDQLALAWQNPSKDKWEVTIAGPQAYGGASDTGANSIEENYYLGMRLLIMKIGQLKVEGINPDSIVVLIKGHSRNAVAATRLANYMATKYKDTKLAVELAAFDPVPGPGHTGDDKDITLDPSITSTVVYSMNLEAIYSVGFDPQKVRGAKRMILSRQGHSAGLTQFFKYSGKIYKGSNLNSLGEGLYISKGAPAPGKPEEIEKVTSEKQLEAFLVLFDPYTGGYLSARQSTIRELSKVFVLKKDLAMATASEEEKKE